MDLDARNIELAQLAIELRFLDSGQARQILREAKQQQLSFVDITRSLRVLDESACLMLEARQSKQKRPKSSHSGQAQLPELGGEVEGFLLTELIGKGGMGAVFKAEKRGLNGEIQTFALKFILTAEARAVERFEREAQAVAAVDRHPNIVSIKSFLRWQGLPCLVFDFVEGEGLDDFMARETLTLRQSTKIVESIASALRYSHEKDVLHRDLKPANVLIRKGDGHVFLTDFGLARLAGASALTRSQDVLGTPHYMSPEQAGSEHELLGPGTDIWALGVIYYELVTGKKPFEGQSTVELMTRIMFSEPRRPSALNDDLPKTVDAVILKALRKEPQQRYGSAQEFLDDCQRVLLGESVQASLVSSFPLRVSGLLRRCGGRVLGGLALTLFLMLLSVGIWWDSHVKDQARSAYQMKVQKEFAVFEADSERFRRKKALVLMEGMLRQSGRETGDSGSQFISARLDSIERLRQLKAEGDLAGFEDAFFESVSKQKWRELNDFSRVNQGLHSGRYDKSTSLSKPWKMWLRGALALKDKDYDGAVKSFESSLSASREVAGLSYFGMGLTESARKDWGSAVLAFENSLKRMDKDQRLVRARVGDILQQCRLELYLTELLSLGDKDRLERLQSQLRDLSSKDWKVLNERLQMRFEAIVEAEVSRSVLVYQQLRACARLNSQLRCPAPNAKLHRELAAQARRTGDIGQALYHKLRLQKLDPESSPGLLSNDDLRQLILDAGFFKRDLEKAFLITLAVSRAGLYVPYLREDWCEALDRKGIFDREVEKDRFDPYPRFWRALAPIQPFSKQRANQRLGDVDFVLKSSDCRVHFKALILQRKAEILRQIAKSYAPSQNRERVGVIESALEDLVKALKMSHPAPDRLYNEMCLLFEEVPRSERSSKIHSRWLKASLSWEKEVERRYERTTSKTLSVDRDEDCPFLPMAFAMRQRTLSFVYRNRSSAYRSGREFDKALSFAKLASRHASSNSDNRVGLYIIKEILLCYIESGRDKEAKAVFDEAVKKGRTVKELTVLRGLWTDNPPALPTKKE